MNSTQLLERLVSIPSISGDEASIADFLAGTLAGEGFAAQREGDSIWFVLGTGRRPHLVLLSHIDTVPACDGWTIAPFSPQVTDGKLFGLGANDAKGCVAALVLAARELRSELLEGTVTFAFVAQEERDGEGIRAVLPQLGRIDAAVVGEPTGLDVCTAQRGLLILRCTARGQAAHAAHPQLGENAIHKAARDIERLAAIRFEGHELLGVARPQVTQISGGLARNQVPDRCEFFVDIRTTPNLDHRTVASNSAAVLESEVEVHSARYEAVSTDESELIVQAALKAANKQHGVGSMTTSDWPFLKGIPAVKAGPGETHRSHRPNEYLCVSELEAGGAFYRHLIRTYFRLSLAEAAHA